jgi:hypothetical protein
VKSSGKERRSIARWLHTFWPEKMAKKISSLRIVIRRISSISLLFMLLFQATGHIFVFKIQQHEIRREIKRRIKAGVPETELVLFKILDEKPDPAFQHVEEHEFRYDGKMYDIVRGESHGDTTWYYCVSDEMETQLFANLEDLVKKDMTGNPQHRKQIDELLRLSGAWYCSPQTGDLFIFSTEQNPLTFLTFSLKTWDLPPSTPPPEA